MIKRNTPAQLNFELYKGDTFLQNFQIKIGGALATITGDVFKMRIQKADGTEVLTVTNGSGVTFPSTGVFQVAISAAATALFPEAALLYDLQWTRSNGQVKTLLRGKIITTKDITPA